jgi:hypothetical protein
MEGLVDVVGQEALQGLALGERPCVFMFLPTHRAGREVQQAPIRRKNLVRRTREKPPHGNTGSAQTAKGR